MNFATTLLIAQTSGASEAAEGLRYLTTYEWSRESQFDDPRQLWLLVALVAVFAIVYVVWFYRRERDVLTPLQSLLMPGLRLLAIAGAIVFFLGLEKRVDQEESRDSRVVILIDTSQSMSVEDERTNSNAKLARAAAVQEALQASPLG